MTDDGYCDFGSGGYALPSYMQVFDGSNSRLELGDPNALNFGNDNFLIHCWSSILVKQYLN